MGVKNILRQTCAATKQNEKSLLNRKTHFKKSFSQKWLLALATKSAGSYQTLAARAEAQGDVNAVAALCELVETQPDLRQRLMGLRKEWRWTRVAAIRTLARIGAKEALPTLISALSDPDPHIRETAAFELPTFGTQAVPLLRYTLRESSDWSLPGMQALIRILGYLGDASATPELIHVLDEQLPGDPKRWTRDTFARPLYFVLILFIMVWSIAGAVNASDTSSPLWQTWLETGLNIFVNGFVPMLFLYMLLVCVVSLPLLNLWAAHERGELVCSAIKTLSRFGNKRLLPVILDIAVSRRHSLEQTHTARTALLPLMQGIRSSDTTRLSPRSRLQLAQILGTADIQLDKTLLNTLEQAGTGQGIPHVKRFIQQTADPELRDQAEHLLGTLMERQQQEAAVALLLRASQAHPAPQTELLRAVSETRPLSTEQLLRPVNELRRH